MIYSIYGLYLDVDLALPGFAPCSAAPAVDVRVRLAPFGVRETTGVAAEYVWYRSPSDHSSEPGEPGLIILRSADDGAFRFRYPDGVEFLIDQSGREVNAGWPPTSTLQDVALYLIGPLLGFLLRLRGVVALHASAVAVDDYAVAFVGPAGAGKSTTAAAFCARGHQVLTEDVAALFERDRAFAVWPGYPHIALWPDSTAMLFGSAAALPTFTSGWEKRRLALTQASSFVAEPLPLRAIYLLSERTGPAGPLVGTVLATTAAMALLGNIYGNLLFHRELRVQELELVRRLVLSVPVKAANPGQDAVALSAFCELVLDDLSACATLQEAVPGTTPDVQHR